MSLGVLVRQYSVILLFLSRSLLAVTLPETYQHALKKNESYSIQESRVGQADERVSQAGGSILPNISLVGSFLRRDSSNLPPGAFTRTEETNARITAVQPIFRGLREFAALSGAKASLRSQEATLQQVKLNLYVSVATAFYNLLSAQQDIANLETLLKLSQDRAFDIKKRAEIGRSRKGELLSAQSQVAQVESQLDGARSLLAQTQQQFAFTTGLPTATPLSDIDKEIAPLSGIENYLKQLENRPDIVALKEQLTSAEEGVAIARGGHLPSIDATGNYYLKRVGVLENSKWDAGVSITIPLFQGGVIQSGVREASLVEKESTLLLAQARRDAERQVRTFYTGLQQLLLQRESLKRASQLSEGNYQEQNRDYRFGLVTNLEVLQAMNNFQETKRAFDRTQYQVKLTKIQLEASAGKIE